MYAGHFAIGIALKARFPEVPTAAVMVGVVLLDLLYGVFVLAGIDQVAPNLASGPYLFFDLTFIDWDHSLAMALFWTAAGAVVFLRNPRVAAVTGAAVFSHFIADWPVHDHDLALFPHSAIHLGYGLWAKLGTLAWVLEGVLAAVLVGGSARAFARRGTSLLWPAVLLALLFLQLSPWLSPMKLVAALGEPAASRMHGLLILVGFVLPTALLTWLLDRRSRL